jgi:hypothetical protein
MMRPSSHVTPLAAGELLSCWYCWTLERKQANATARAHDRRGCKAVCETHARWRLTTSSLPGHGADCPEAHR